MLLTAQAGWGDIASDFIMREDKVIGLNPKSIRRKFPGARIFYHIMAGYGDFSLQGYNTDSDWKGCARITCRIGNYL